ncbi:MAG TPA: SGNH/GDSL hydrolase family protein [Nocardioidaceae bacterium]|nr:SGNH/GDSL hydrolase family protein [Nocardioidaceae bacterium]
MLRAVMSCVLVLALGACTSEQLSPQARDEAASQQKTQQKSQQRAQQKSQSRSQSSSSSAPTRSALTGAYDEYVALGDSFTAGPLIAPEDPNGGACGRSLVNYPHLLAERLDVDALRDVSCSGASTEHLTQRQSNLFGTNPPQFRALSPSTDLVTLGIGGNDFGVFAELVTTCARARAADPEGAPCGDRLADVTDVFAQTQKRLVDALHGVRRRSPEAEVVVVGYPQLAPARGTCPDVLPFADGDYIFARRVERQLNRALRQAARSAQAEFVDVAGPSQGHSACAGEQAWVNGRRAVDGEALSYHPLERGMAAVADLVYAELG